MENDNIMTKQEEKVYDQKINVSNEVINEIMHNDTINNEEISNIQNIKINFINCDYVLGAAFEDQIPFDKKLPEIAFVGRSNVGKSSLVNAVFKDGVAKVSKTPGRTQLLNFFNVDDKIFMVDLPGYGYAKVSHDLKRDWNKLIFRYLKGRVLLRRVFLLIDARHGIKPSDFNIMDILESAAVVYQIILTKIDKINLKQAEQLKEEIERKITKRTAAFPIVITSSAEKKIGITEIRSMIESLIN